MTRSGSDDIPLGHMKRVVTLIAIATFAFSFAAELAAANTIPKPPASGDLSYLLGIDPSTVSDQDLEEHVAEVEDNYQLFHQSNGIHWPAHFSTPALEHPDQLGSGGDSAIFTGMYLTGAVYRFQVTRRAEDLEKVVQAVRAIHLITHISGYPGELARCAFPILEATRFAFPQAWKGWIDNSELYQSDDQVRDVIQGGNYPRMIYVTRPSRDQISGVLAGLATVKAELTLDLAGEDVALRQRIEFVRGVARDIVLDVYGYIEKNGFVLKDHDGKFLKTSRNVDGYVKMLLLKLYQWALEESGNADEAAIVLKTYRMEFAKHTSMDGGSFADLINGFANFQDYYAWNLRFIRLYGVFLLDTEPFHRRLLQIYAKNFLWPYVRWHKNAHFTFLYSIITDDRRPVADGIISLKSLALRPLRSWSSPLHDQAHYPSNWRNFFGGGRDLVVLPQLRNFTEDFLWQRDPFEVGEKIDDGHTEATGLDLILPYWTARAKGLF